MTMNDLLNENAKHILKIARLEDQVEKMKCCVICSFRYDGHCIHDGTSIEWDEMKICDKWELADD